MQSKQSNNTNFNRESHISDLEYSALGMRTFRDMISEGLDSGDYAEALEFVLKRTSAVEQVESGLEKNIAALVTYTMTESQSLHKVRRSDTAHEIATRFILEFFERSSKHVQKLLIQKLNDYVYEYDILCLRVDTASTNNDPKYWRLGLAVELTIAGLVDLDLTVVLHFLFSVKKPIIEKVNAGIKVLRRLLKCQSKIAEMKVKHIPLPPPPSFD